MAYQHLQHRPRSKATRRSKKVNVLFYSLNLGNDFANQIEQVHRFKTHNEPEKIATIQVTVKMDGNGGPMWTATEITKAAKCLKDTQ